MSDMLHSDLQFKNPEWCFFSDNNEEKAIKTRKSAFDELSQPNTIIANGHFDERSLWLFKKRRRR